MMKILNVKEKMRAAALILGLAFTAVLPAFAQPNNNNNSNSGSGARAERTETARTETQRTVVREEDNDTDWGWLGLLGLLGLAGLIPKKRRVEVQEFRDTRPETNQPTTDGTTTDVREGTGTTR